MEEFCLSISPNRSPLIELTSSFVYCSFLNPLFRTSGDHIIRKTKRNCHNAPLWAKRNDWLLEIIKEMDCKKG